MKGKFVKLKSYKMFKKVKQVNNQRPLKWKKSEDILI